MVSQTLQLDLDVVLPHAHSENDRCVTDLVASLEGLDGIERVHVVRERPGGGSDGEVAKVCLHAEPGVVSMPRLAQRVRSAGALLDDRYGHLVTEVDGVGHSMRATALTQRLRSLSGVVDAVVTIEGVIRVEYDRAVIDDGALRASLATIVGGAEDTSSTRRDDGSAEHGPSDGHDHGHGASRVELGAAFVALAIYLVARGLDWFSDVGTTVTVLYVVAAIITGVFVARDAWLSVQARVFDIDQLMLIAAVGAALIGHWSDSALLLVLFSLGHALEGYAMNRARHAIEALGELAPATARRKGEEDVEVPVGDLVVGDVVVVRPNERIPADGVIVAGETSIDESAVTGESVPVDKRAVADLAAVGTDITAVSSDHRTFAGALNGPGAIDLMVLRAAEDSTLARVVQLVAEAETQISPSQRLTNRIVRVFVPAVLTLVAMLLVVPPLAGESFTDSFARAMAVLVAASPCALAIATPSAVLAAIARAARGGILVKGGGPLEALGTVGAVAFDKTGTLTAGEPALTDIEPTDVAVRQQLLTVSFAVERSSDHPIARAVTAALSELVGKGAIPAVSNVTAINGKGVSAVVDDEVVLIGNVALFDGIEIPEAVLSSQAGLEAQGRTTMIVRHGERFLGVLGVMDTPREEAPAAIDALRSLGIDSIVMLSGDNQRVATAVADHVGISEAFGGLLPADKVDKVKALAAGDGVAMIGDGVNDAPALAAADVGIAMGAAGSDVALETADIAMMADRLDHLPLSVGLARRASRTIRQNLYFSLGVVAALIPMTLAGVGISIAVIAHEGSTLVVVVNALRLLNYRYDTASGDGR